MIDGFAFDTDATLVADCEWGLTDDGYADAEGESVLEKPPGVRCGWTLSMSGRSRAFRRKIYADIDQLGVDPTRWGAACSLRISGGGAEFQCVLGGQSEPFTPSDQERFEKLQLPIGLVFEYRFICIPFVGRTKDQTAFLVEYEVGYPDRINAAQQFTKDRGNY